MPGIEPISQGFLKHWGAVSEDCAPGLKLRIDPAPTLSEHLQNQIRFWEITPSFAFLEQPQTNGVVERLFRTLTLKEQIFYGRVYETVDDLMAAVDRFVD